MDGLPPLTNFSHGSDYQNIPVNVKTRGVFCKQTYIIQGIFYNTLFFTLLRDLIVNNFYLIFSKLSMGCYIPAHEFKKVALVRYDNNFDPYNNNIIMKPYLT